MEDSSIRDRLAVERTKLAEERTYLAYIRTGMSLALGGAFFVGYFQQGTLFAWIGWATVVVALIFLAYGFYKHEKTMNLIKQILGLKKKN